MVKSKLRATNLPVPQNDVEAAAAIARIGEIERAIGRNKADADQRIREIAADAALAAAPMKEQAAAAIDGLRIYCEAHRARLTGDGRSKSAKFATGTIAWRARPPKVTLPRAREAVAELIERLRTLRLDRFLRTKCEIDKEAMLAEPAIAAGVAGISIGSAGEDFVVEPLAMADTIRPDREAVDAEAAS